MMKQYVVLLYSLALPDYSSLSGSYMVIQNKNRARPTDLCQFKRKLRNRVVFLNQKCSKSDILNKAHFAVIESGLSRNDTRASPMTIKGIWEDRKNIAPMIITFAILNKIVITAIAGLNINLHVSSVFWLRQDETCGKSVSPRKVQLKSFVSLR